MSIGNIKDTMAQQNGHPELIPIHELVGSNHADLATHIDCNTNPDLHSYWRVFVFHADWTVSVCCADSHTINGSDAVCYYEINTSPMS